MDKDVKNHPLIKAERERQARVKKRAHEKKIKISPREAKYIKERSKPGVSKTEAYRRAGMAVKDPKSEKAIRLERKVQENIREQMAANKLDANRVLLEVWRMALVDLGNLFDDDGNLISVPLLDEDTRRAIVSAEIKRERNPLDNGTEIYSHKYRTGKEKAIEMLMRHFGKLSGEEGTTKKDRLDEVIEALRDIPQPKEESK